MGAIRQREKGGRAMPLLAGAEPFAHTGSADIGVLLCHGFTSTPQSMRGWAEHLAGAGCTVRLPRLPGHGTTWREMAKTGWPEWYGAVERELGELRQRCESVFVFGQSMGGTLALRLAEQHGDAVAGLVLVNPSVIRLSRTTPLLPLLSRIVPSVRGVAGDIAKPGVTELAYDRVPVRAAASLARLWALTRADLPRIRQPLLLFRSAADHVVEPENARIVLDTVCSRNVTEVLLENSFHVATLDHDAPLVFRRSVEFVQAVRDAGQVGAR